MHDSNAIPRTPDPNAEPGWQLRLEARLGLLDPISLLVFRSFGTPDALHIRGRVSEKKGVSGTLEQSSLWQNVLNTLNRLDSDEIPGAHVRAHLDGKQWDTHTDGEGYFVLDLDPTQPLDPGWHEVELELVETLGEPAQRRVRVEVLVPPADAEFAVISDLDDTVIESHANELFRQITILFGESARTRTPFPGIPALYRALRRGPDDRGINPLFYVSKSGWNLYDLFKEFMDANRIPRGPLFLSDLRVIEDKSQVIGSDLHKFESIDLLLRTYHGLAFVLIGDSGQHDPETYRNVVKEHPGRIRAIYIRDVSDPERDREVDRIASEVAAEGVPLIRGETTLSLAEDAAGRGLISGDGLEEVRADAARDEAEDASG